MNKKRILQILTAIPLGVVASMILIFENNAHVSMCMISAICYSLGLLTKKSKFASFFSGGILFYTIYAGSTLLLLGWFGILHEEYHGEGFIFIDGSWIYHFLINFAILILFLTKSARIRYILTGLEIFLITSPIMLLIRQLFDRVLWGSPKRIIVYVSVGLILFIVHRLIALLGKEIYSKILIIVRKFIIISLLIYTVLLVIAIPVNEVVNKDRRLNERFNGSRGFDLGCKSDPNFKFLSDITDLEEVSFIVPPGGFEEWEGGTILKTHSYIVVSEKVPVYAPTDSILYEGSFYIEEGMNQYSLFFQISCEYFYIFDHIQEPVEKIVEVFPNTPTYDSRTITTSSNVEFRAGELVGYSTGTKYAHHWDFGLYRYEQENFLSDSSIQNLSDRDRRAVCPFDYFNEKEKYYSIFGNLKMDEPVPDMFCK